MLSSSLSIALSTSPSNIFQLDMVAGEIENPDRCVGSLPVRRRLARCTESVTFWLLIKHAARRKRIPAINFGVCSEWPGSLGGFTAMPSVSCLLSATAAATAAAAAAAAHSFMLALCTPRNTSACLFSFESVQHIFSLEFKFFLKTIFLLS